MTGQIDKQTNAFSYCFYVYWKCLSVAMYRSNGAQCLMLKVRMLRTDLLNSRAEFEPVAWKSLTGKTCQDLSV